MAGLGFLGGIVVGLLIAGTLLPKVAQVREERALSVPSTQDTTAATTDTTTTAPTTNSDSTTTKSKTETKSSPAAGPPIADSDLGCNLSEIEKFNIEKWIKNTPLNKYGDPVDTAYTGGTPLYNEFTGKTTERCQYILDNHPTKPWNS